MLYADNTVVLSETEDDEQYQLHSFQIYCDKWKLQVNIEKNTQNYFFYYFHLFVISVNYK